MTEPPCDKGAPQAEQPDAADRTEVEKAQLALDDLDTMHGQASRPAAQPGRVYSPSLKTASLAPFGVLTLQAKSVWDAEE
ncbi:hypothetical protein ACIGFJ_13530 [Brevundimonas diminuta]|uniref:hypothetical protein n=1 Tax=Brevundimonas diminuta TaxID=293 RepID=UPI0037C5B0EE